MCGIFGLIGRQPVASRLMKGAGRLQNRGDRSTGMVTYDRKFFFQHSALQPPLIAFAGVDAERLKGNCGVVHTRYPTSGTSSPEFLERNKQPVIAERPSIATCNNGDLINMISQTEKLRGKGFSFQTQVDAKVIQSTMIDAMLQNRVYTAKTDREYANGLFDALEQVHDQLVGAYSVVNILDRGLLAYKDPHGIRPLAMAHRVNGGRKPLEVAFSSETSVFNYFGDYTRIRELEPGEAIFISHNLTEYRRIVTPKREAFCFFEFIYFARPDSQFSGKYVEPVREELGRVLAEEYRHMKDRIDVVCPLPGTAMSAAQEFAETLNLPIRHAIIKAENKRSFQETSDDKRKKAIDDKFLFVRDFIQGKRVAIIDDSNVRGTTSKKVVARLRELGAKEIHFFFYCPPIIGPCYYGIDTPDEKRLLAYNKTNEQIRRAMKTTTVNYISHKGLLAGLGIPDDQLCRACVTRKYPTSTDEIRTRALQRARQKRQSRGC